MNDSVNCLCMVLLLCIGLSVILFGISIIYVYDKHKKILEKFTEYEIDANATINDEIPKILDLFIQDTFNEYRAKFLDPMAFHFIRPEEEKKIIRELSDTCSNRISTAMVHKLSLFWEPHSIGSVMADKIYLTVLSYVAQNNSVYSNQLKENDKK